MLISSSLLDGVMLCGGTYCLSKTSWIHSLQHPLNPSGLALSAASNTLVLAATSHRSEIEKAAAIACATLFLCAIAKPLATRTTILLSPYAAIQLAAFHGILKVTIYGIYKLAQHFTVSFNPSTVDDIKKIPKSDLGTHKAELERSMVEKWDSFNLNMQAAFNVMLVENGQAPLPFTNYTRVALLSEKELKVFKTFVGDHLTKKEQSQVLFDHDLPPPKQFDFLPDPTAETVSLTTLSPRQLLWYHQAFSSKLVSPAQTAPFTLAFYEADLLPPSNAFFTPLTIPSSANEVSKNQAHYFVNYDHHHPDTFGKLTEEKQIVLNEIFVKAGKTPYSLNKPKEPPIETSSWSTAKKVMIYGGCALAVIALIAVPTAAYFFARQTAPLSPLDSESLDQPCFLPIAVDQKPPLPKQPFTHFDNSTICLPHEKPVVPQNISSPIPQLNTLFHPNFPLAPFNASSPESPIIQEEFPQNPFRIDLSRFIKPYYEPTPANQSISVLYPSLESCYAICSPDEKPLPVINTEFPIQQLNTSSLSASPDIQDEIQTQQELPFHIDIALEKLLYGNRILREIHKKFEMQREVDLLTCSSNDTPFPQEHFWIDLRHLIKSVYEPTPPNKSISILYPSLESRYTFRSPVEKPLHEEFPSSLLALSSQVLFTKSTNSDVSPFTTYRPPVDLENQHSFSWESLSLLAIPSLILFIDHLFNNLAHRGNEARPDSFPITVHNKNRAFTLSPLSSSSHYEIRQGSYRGVLYLQLVRGSNLLALQNPQLQQPWELIDNFVHDLAALGSMFQQNGENFQCITLLNPNPELFALVQKQLIHPEGLGRSSMPLQLPYEGASSQKMSQPHVELPIAALSHPNLISSSASFISHPSIDFRDELYLKLMAEHAMRPACAIDHSLYQIEDSHLPKAFEKLSHFRVHALEGIVINEENPSNISQHFSQEKQIDIAKLVAKITAEKAKVNWNDIKSFSFDFFNLGPNFNSTLICVQLTDDACECLRLPTNSFADAHSISPQLSKPKEEPTLYDKSALLSLAEDLAISEDQTLFEKLSQVKIHCESWDSNQSWTLQDKELANFPYYLKRVMPPECNVANLCKNIKAATQKIVEEMLNKKFEEIAFYDLIIYKTPQTLTFIFSVSLDGENYALLDTDNDSYGFAHTTFLSNA
ncbi:MAG: hypothetical protein H7A42_06190 [Chlamydiales bacterium]|nr:hypothetical protein [Chlamydiales bacterium]